MYLNEWGPIAWELFHYITYTYKPELKEYYTIFFSTLYSIIPCPHCSNDIKGILTSHLNFPSHHTMNKNDIIEWYIKIHNMVNTKLKAPDTFTRADANAKYLPNGEISIDHARILKFIKLSITTKGGNNSIDSDISFKRNIIALCCIYPVGVDLYNPNLMYFINYSIITNDSFEKWYNIFEELVLNKENYKPRDITVKYPIRDLKYTGSLKHLELFSPSNNKIVNTKNRLVITDYPKNKYSSIVVSSTDSIPVIINKSYTIYNDISTLYIYINGGIFSKTGYINIKSNILTNTITNIKNHKIQNKDTKLKIEYSNLKRDTTVNILFEFLKKVPGDNFIINDICLIGL